MCAFSFIPPRLCLYSEVPDKLKILGRCRDVRLSIAGLDSDEQAQPGSTHAGLSATIETDAPAQELQAATWKPVMLVTWAAAAGREVVAEERAATLKKCYGLLHIFSCRESRPTIKFNSPEVKPALI